MMQSKTVFCIYFEDNDDCQMNPCAHGYCVDHDASFECVCDSGYTGVYCHSGKIIIIMENKTTVKVWTWTSLIQSD